MPTSKRQVDDIISGLTGQVNQLRSTGVKSGLGATINGGDNSKFDIQIIGQIIDPVTFAQVNINVNLIAQTVTNLATQNSTFIGINNIGMVVQQSTPFTTEQKFSLIGEWELVHYDNTTITHVNAYPNYQRSLAEQLHSFMDNLGYLNNYGNVFSPNGVNLKIDKTIGSVQKVGIGNQDSDNINEKIFASQIQATFSIINQDGTEITGLTNIDVTNYDLGGTTTALPGVAIDNYWQTYRIYLYGYNQIKLQRGQTIYTSIAEAQSKINLDAYSVEAGLNQSGLLRGYLIVKKGTTDLSNTTENKFIEADKFGLSPIYGLTPTLQNGYDASTTPVIKPNDIRGAFQVQSNRASNALNIQEWKNLSSSITAYIKGDGSFYANPAPTRANLLIDSITFHGNTNYNILTTDKTVATNAALTAPRTWTLPAANSVNPGYEISVTDHFGGVTPTNKIIVAAFAGDTVNGAASVDIDTQYSTKKFISDGTTKWTATISSGLAGGDLSGTYPNPTVVWANGYPTYDVRYALSGSGVLSFNTRTGAVTSQAGDYTTTIVAEGTNLYYTQARFDTAFAAKTTTNLTEGTNLYFTDERVDDRVAALIQNGTGLNWSYVDGSNTLTGNVTLAPFSTTNLAEGTNLYYTQARFDTAFAAKSTTNLAEGTNLYFTDERVDDRVAALIQNGTGLSWSYVDGSNTLTGNVSLSPFTTTNLAEGINLYYTNARFDARLAATVAGGELAGNYPNPTLVNSAVIGKVLTGVAFSTFTTISATDTILASFGKVQAQINYHDGTRVTGGTGVVINGGDNTKFDINITGVVIDPTTYLPTTVTVSLTSQTVTYIATQAESYLTITSAGTVLQSQSPPNPEDFSQNLGTWVLVHSNLINLNTINPLPNYGDRLGVQLHQLMNFIGFNKYPQTNQIAAGTTGTRISKSGGRVIKNGIGDLHSRNTKNLSALVDATIRMRNRDGAEGADTQTIDVVNIDIAGVTTALQNNNKFGAHKVWLFPSNLMRIQRGQYQYDNLAEALARIDTDVFIDEGNCFRNGLHIGWLVFRKNTTWAGGTAGADYQFIDVTGGKSTSAFIPTIQNAYSVSTQPQLLIDAVRNALIFQNNRSGNDALTVFESKNFAGTITASVTGDGTNSAVKFLTTGTAGAGYIEFLAQSSDTTAGASTGFRLFAGSAGSLKWARKNGGDTFVREITATLTANRTYTLQDASGTLAFLSDIVLTGSSFEPVISQLNTPPAHVSGERYLVGAAPTGAWAANANNIAESNGVSWTFTAPITNNTVFLTSTSQTFKYNGTSWVLGQGTPVLHNGNTLAAILQIGTNDNFNVNIKTNGIVRWSFTTAGLLTRTNGTATTNIVEGFMTVLDTSVTALPGFQITQTITLNRFANLLRYGQTGAGNFTGTTISSADTLQLSNGGTGANPYPIMMRGSILYTLTGHTTTFVGSRQDTVGFRLGALNTLQTTNVNPFTVVGMSAMGANNTATAFVDAAASTTAIASMRLRAGTAPTTPNNGDVWNDGTYMVSQQALSSKAYVGTGNRLVESDSTGNMSATKELIDGFLTAGANATNLETGSNWTGTTYTGTAITGTYQGQMYYDATYYYVAVADNTWIRILRSLTSKMPYRAVTAASSFTSNDYTISCTGVSGYNVTLPTAVGITGTIYIIKNKSGATKTLDTTSSQTIDGSTTQSIASGNSMTVQSDGANWEIIG